jgi:hypothetical protein
MYKSLNHIIMNNLLYVFAVLLVIFWALGFFVYNAGNIINILLVIAVIAILLRIINGKSITK